MGCLGSEESWQVSMPRTRVRSQAFMAQNHSHVQPEICFSAHFLNHKVSRELHSDCSSSPVFPSLPWGRNAAEASRPRVARVALELAVVENSLC